MYAVTAQIRTHPGKTWHGSVQVPTFYLNGDVQGITDIQHAVTIAHDVVNPLGMLWTEDVIITVTEVQNGQTA